MLFVSVELTVTVPLLIIKEPCCNLEVSANVRFAQSVTMTCPPLAVVLYLLTIPPFKVVSPPENVTEPFIPLFVISEYTVVPLVEDVAVLSIN